VFCGRRLKKGRQLFGEKEKCTPLRQNPAYAYVNNSSISAASLGVISKTVSESIALSHIQCVPKSDAKIKNHNNCDKSYQN